MMNVSAALRDEKSYQAGISSLIESNASWQISCFWICVRYSYESVSAALEGEFVRFALVSCLRIRL